MENITWTQQKKKYLQGQTNLHGAFWGNYQTVSYTHLQVNAVLFEGKNPAEAVDELMLREQKSEHSALPWPEDK